MGGRDEKDEEEGRGRGEGEGYGEWDTRERQNERVKSKDGQQEAGYGQEKTPPARGVRDSPTPKRIVQYSMEEVEEEKMFRIKIVHFVRQIWTGPGATRDRLFIFDFVAYNDGI